MIHKFYSIKSLKSTIHSNPAKSASFNGLPHPTREMFSAAFKEWLRRS